MGNKTYDDLSLRQKSLVDALALESFKEETLTKKEIVELAHELSGEKKYVPEYVSDFESKHEDIIENRVQILANEREGGDGEVVTIGDPFRSYTGPNEGIDATMQHIKDRPVKSVEDNTVQLELTKEKVFRIMRQADEDIAQEIFEQISR